MSRNTTTALAAALLALGAKASDASQPVEVRFAGEFGGALFSCANIYENVGVAGSTVEVADYRLFVSNLRLIASDGAETPIALDQDGVWQAGDVALLDFEDGSGSCVNGTVEMNAVIRGSAPNGVYSGLSFDIGVPFEVNHGDPTLAGSPLNLTAMFWNWRGGYKFLKLDLATAGLPLDASAAAAQQGDHGAATGAGARGWSLHLGSTGCASSSRTTAPTGPCVNSNVITVTFEDFDLASQVVVIDPAAVLTEANVDVNAPDTSPGCMSFPGDPDCMTVMTRLGLAYGDVAAGEQRLVSTR